MIYYPILLPCFLNFAFDISLPPLPLASAEAPPCAAAAMRTKKHTHQERKRKKGREREAEGVGGVEDTPLPPPPPRTSPRQRERACTVSGRVVTQRNKIKHAPKHIHPSRNIAYLVGNNSCLPAAPAPPCCHPRIVARLGAKQKQCQQQWSQCRQHLCASPASLGPASHLPRA